MKNQSNDVLVERIDNLTKLVEDGFKGVHERQDTTNGKVIKNTEFRIATTAQLTLIKWLFGFLGIGNIVLLIKLLLQ